MPTSTSRDVRTPSAAYTRMEPSRTLIRDLLGGTERMRAAGETYLPKEPKEPKLQWLRRLERAILYEAYADHVDSVVSRPFSRKVALLGAPPPAPLDTIYEDAGHAGNSLHEVARASFRDAANYGMSGFLVDMPATLTGQEHAGITDRIA